MTIITHLKKSRRPKTPLQGKNKNKEVVKLSNAT
jgi:hypothetical protein